MSRRPAQRLRYLLVAATAALTACGGEPRETPNPPPIAAAKPAPVATPVPTPAPTPAPTTSPATRPAPPAQQTQAPPTVVTSAPGAIPPAPLPDPNAKPDEKPVDPLKWMQDRQARQADYQRRLESTQAEVDGATQDAATWDRVALEFKNPFLPRPQLSADDQAAIQGMSNPERVKWAEDRAGAAKMKLVEAQKKLDDLKANPPPS